MKIAKIAPFGHYYVDDLRLSFIDKLFIKPKHRHPSFNRNMFDEDFAGIFRSASRRSDNLFSVESSNDELTQRLFRNTRTRHGHQCIDEIVRELVEEIAQSLIWYGTAYYFLYDTFEQEEIHIAPFSAIGVFHFFNMYFQLVPKRLERHWDGDDKELPRELRILDSTKLMQFNMPRSIRQMLSKQNRILAALDKHQYDGTGFYLKATHENRNPKNDFNFHVWRDTQEQVLYRATRDTGWNGRKYSSKCSDFFICHRLIRFRRNQLILRDHILDQLSNEFTRVGRQYNAAFYVTISPTNVLPKIDKLNDLEARLLTEEVSFTEVLNICYER